MSSRAQIQLAADARGDLREIYRRRFLQRGADGADGAAALLDSMVMAIGELAEWPERGPIPQELNALGIHDYRQISLPPFRIIYLVEQTGDGTRITVQIIADARRDFTTLLQERLINRR